MFGLQRLYPQLLPQNMIIYLHLFTYFNLKSVAGTLVLGHSWSVYLYLFWLVYLFIIYLFIYINICS